MKHPSIRYTEDGGAGPFNYAKAPLARRFTFDETRYDDYELLLDEDIIGSFFDGRVAMNLLKNKTHRNQERDRTAEDERAEETVCSVCSHGTVDLHWGDLRLCRRRSADRSQ